jgi:hypothetical protein
LGFKGTATGGGSVKLSPVRFFPNIWQIDFALGPNPGANTYTVSFGDLAPTQFAIHGN